MFISVQCIMASVNFMVVWKPCGNVFNKLCNHTPDSQPSIEHVFFFVCVESGNKTSDTDLDGVLIEWKPWRKGSSWRKSRCIVGGQQRFDTDWRWLQSCRGVDWWWIWCRSWWHFEVQWVVDVGIVLSLCFVCYFFVCLLACWNFAPPCLFFEGCQGREGCGDTDRESRRASVT